MLRSRLRRLSNHEAPISAPASVSRRARRAPSGMRSVGEPKPSRPSAAPTRRSRRRRDLVRIVEDELRLTSCRPCSPSRCRAGTSTALGSTRIFTPLVLDHLVGRADLMGVFHRVGLPGAAAVLIRRASPTISESARLVSSVIRCAAASVSFMTCGRGPRLRLGGGRW